MWWRGEGENLSVLSGCHARKKGGMRRRRRRRRVVVVRKVKKKNKKSVLTTFNFTTSGPLMDGLVNDGILRQFTGSDLMGFPLKAHIHTNTHTHAHTLDEPAPLIQTPASPAPQRRANTSSPGCAHARTHTPPVYSPPIHTHTQTHAHCCTLIIRKHADVFHHGLAGRRLTPPLVDVDADGVGIWLTTPCMLESSSITSQLMEACFFFFFFFWVKYL